MVAIPAGPLRSGGVRDLFRDQFRDLFRDVLRGVSGGRREHLCPAAGGRFTREYSTLAVIAGFTPMFIQW